MVTGVFWFVPPLRRAAGSGWEFTKALLGIDTSIDAIEVTPGHLLADYAVDNVQATRKWTGQMVAMSGAVGSEQFHPDKGAQTIYLIDPLDNATVAMPRRKFVVCNIDPESSQQIKIDQQGKQLRLVGRCIGIRDFEGGEHFVVVTGCRLGK
jgi:hypothetical protein